MNEQDLVDDLRALLEAGLIEPDEASEEPRFRVTPAGLKVAMANGVTTAACGCLVLEDEVCPECGGCGPRGVEWQGCCECQRPHVRR